MSNKGQLLQDPFLNTLRKEHVPVAIYLVNVRVTREAEQTLQREIVTTSALVDQWRTTRTQS